MQTYDLGHGWFANFHNDAREALTLRNPDKGLKIVLEKDSLKRLREAFRSVKTA